MCAAFAEVNLSNAVKESQEGLPDALEQTLLGPALEPVKGGTWRGVFRAAGNVLITAAGLEAVHEAVEDFPGVFAFASQTGLWRHEGLDVEPTLS